MKINCIGFKPEAAPTNVVSQLFFLKKKKKRGGDPKRALFFFEVALLAQVRGSQHAEAIHREPRGEDTCSTCPSTSGGQSLASPYSSDVSKHTRQTAETSMTLLKVNAFSRKKDAITQHPHSEETH